jgi:Ankyrin repeats (3 copies)
MGYQTVKRVLRQIPWSLQTAVLRELMSLATLDGGCDNDRGQAAFCVAECYALGFGKSSWQNQELADWLFRAAEYGSRKAICWYSRICFAIKATDRDTNDTTGFHQLEKELSTLPAELYLSHRVRRYRDCVMKQADDITKLKGPFTNMQELLSGYVCKIGLFNAREFDDLELLHLAAFLGRTNIVEHMLPDEPEERLSKFGFNATHYACMGGHLSTLKIIISHDNSLAWRTGSRGITPLHLCALFTPDAVRNVVKLLMDNGADPNASTTELLDWEFHDIRCQKGTAIEWAVRLRHRQLVRSLIPHSKDLKSALEIATMNFFWEIAEDIMQHSPRLGQILTSKLWYWGIRRPFHQWLAHGQGEVVAMDKVLRLYKATGALEHTFNGTLGDVTKFSNLICSAQVQSDFILIDRFLYICSSEYLKWEQSSNGQSALLWALWHTEKREDDDKWRMIIKKIVDLYTIEELQERRLFDYTFLHHAVRYESRVGVQILLEKGVDANQPTFQNADSWQQTPLYMALWSETREIFNLLREYGADDMGDDDIAEFYTQDTRTLYPIEQGSLKEQAADPRSHEDPGMNSLSKLLHNLVNQCALGGGHNDLQRVRDFLELDNVVKLVNSVDGDGLSLIRKAAEELHPELLTLLLEAGADASVTTFHQGEKRYPLESACISGWLLHWIHRRTGKTGRAEDAMRSARELLKWHQAKGGEMFHGITELHLAAAMMSHEAVEQLVEAGFDTHTTGNWPDTGHPMMPRELATAYFQLAERVGTEELFRHFWKNTERASQFIGIESEDDLKAAMNTIEISKTELERLLHMLR